MHTKRGGEEEGGGGAEAGEVEAVEQELGQPQGGAFQGQFETERGGRR